MTTLHNLSYANFSYKSQQTFNKFCFPYYVSGLATILQRRSQCGTPASDVQVLVLVVSPVPVPILRTLPHSYPGDESLDNGQGCSALNIGGLQVSHIAIGSEISDPFTEKIYIDKEFSIPRLKIRGKNS